MYRIKKIRHYLALCNLLYNVTCIDWYNMCCGKKNLLGKLIRIVVNHGTADILNSSLHILLRQNIQKC